MAGGTKSLENAARFELYTMAADGSNIVRVTDNRRPELFPDWQPLP